jgi:hypothetical protein
MLTQPTFPPLHVPSLHILTYSHRQLVAEGIEWFIEDQAFLRSYDSAPRPPPPLPLTEASCLSFSVFLCVAGLAYGRRGVGRGAWSSINHSILSGWLGRENLPTYLGY